MKWLFHILVLILLLPLTYATNLAPVGENITLWADAIEQPAFATINRTQITIYAPNGSVIVSGALMDLVAQGRFKYDFSIPIKGNYYTYYVYSNDTNEIGISSQSFTGENSLEDNLDMILGSFLLVVIGLLFLIVGTYLKDATWFFAATTWFIAISTVTVFTGVNYLNAVFYFLLAIGSLYHGVNFVITTKKEENELRET